MAESDESNLPRENRGKRILIYAGVAVVIFLLGLVPMGLAAYSRAGERDKARAELRACKVEGYLASAAIDARLGNYEPARQSASNFFADLRAEVDKGNDSAFSQVQRDKLQALMTPRDELITLLARSDPASADRLAQLYSSFRTAVSE